MTKRQATFVLALLTSSLMSVAAPADESDTVEGAHIVVRGSAERVYAFHGALKGILSAVLVDGDLGTAGVSCTLGLEQKSCDGPLAAAAANNTPTYADYVVYRDYEKLLSFILAWDRMQDSKVDELSIAFDSNVQPQDCSGAKQPCVSATMCAATIPRRCDQVKGAPCTSCGTP